MRIHTTGAYVAAAALLVVMFFGVRTPDSAMYTSDESYVRDAVAASVASTGVYGIDGVPKPAIRDAWWRWLGGKLMIVSRADAAVLFQMLALLSSLGLLYMINKIVSLQYPQHEFICWISGFLLVLASSVLLWVSAGEAYPLGAFLVLLAVVLHMSSSSEGRPLPLSAAVCIGLAATLRIEFISVWLALIVHAAVLSVTKKKSVPMAASLLNGLNGLLVTALFLAPLINWNYRLIQVPWPRSYDAAVALDALSGGDASVTASFAGILTASVKGAWTLWLTGGYASSLVVKIFAGGGLIYWIARSRGGSRDNYITLALVLITTPLFHALFVPFIGWSGAESLYAGLLPIWILAVISGVVAVQHALDPVFAKVIPAFKHGVRYKIVLGLVALTPLLNGVVHQSVLSGQERSVALEMHEAVQRTRNDFGGREAALITDQPGRWAGIWDGPVYDLTSELNPEFLYYMTGAPHESLVQIIDDVKERSGLPVNLYVWNQPYWVPADHAPCGENPVNVMKPYVCMP